MNKKKKLDQNTIQTAKRLLKYMTGTHKIQFIIVFICIFISSAASIAVSLSLKFLLDDFIIPLIGQTDPNFAELYKALAVLGCIFALGVIATFIYTRMMVYIGQGVLKSVRDDMFEHMQTLPIRYFDELEGFCSKTLSCRHERLFDLWPPILFNYCYGSACSNLCCICFICINMHFQCKAVVYTNLDLIEDGSSLIICLY